MNRTCKKNKAKRKKGSSTDEEFVNLSKVYKKSDGGPSEDYGEDESSVSVSHILKATNSVLFDDQVFTYSNTDQSISNASSILNVGDMSKTSKKCAETAVTAPPSPSNADIIMYLKKIEGKIENVDLKLKTLDILEKKVDNFENDLKKMWLNIHENKKCTDEKINKLEDRVEVVEYAGSRNDSKLEDLQKINTELKGEISYLKSQQMRNNLLFGGVPEIPNEKPIDTERILRKHMCDNLKLAKELVDDIKIERAHRIGTRNSDPTKFYNRKIVCMFSYFKDREHVRKQRYNLNGTSYYLQEQFPPEVVNKRRRLIPLLRKAKDEHKEAWISYDTLFIEGKPVKVD